MRIALFFALSFALFAAGCQSTHEYFDAPADETAGETDAADVDPDAGEVDPDATEADAPVGTETCSAVLTCMQACPDLTCVDACRATVCPANADELDALMVCVERDCATPCADFSDPACTTCVTSACGTEGFACFGAAC
jgi:hypothetical protein